MKRLLLAGAGHSQLAVLRALARQRSPDLEVLLLSSNDRQIYSGMLPGWVAGHYAVDEIDIPLAPLAQAAGARLVLDELAGLDAAQQTVLTRSGRAIEFDFTSLATGAAMNLDAIPGAAQYTLPLRPFEQFIDRWTLLQLRLAALPQPYISVIGGGAAGIEIALAISHRMRKAPAATRMQLVSGGTLLAGHSAAARELAAHTLRAREIRVFDELVASVDAASVHLLDGAAFSSDATVLATGVVAPAWVAASGLATDEYGFIAVDTHLQSVSHPGVFAAGDVATMIDRPRPKSGVFAVRAGPVLAHNLIAAARGESLKAHRPWPIALNLLSTGRSQAIASWGPFAMHGHTLWRWKDHIDRGFIADYRHP
ncbi:MAG: FAD-dependent oxidoreductase [Burkholderiaceae bacterium]